MKSIQIMMLSAGYTAVAYAVYAMYIRPVLELRAAGKLSWATFIDQIL